MEGPFLKFLFGGLGEGFFSRIPEVLGSQLSGQAMAQRNEVMGVETGIFQLFCLQGASCPVIALPFLVQDNPKMLFEDLGQSQLLVAEQFAGDSRIKEIA